MRHVDARAAKGTVRPTSPPHASVPTAAVVELRQYTLHPRQRDVLIELFDRKFVETQEAVGMTVIGQFRDLDDPDRFVWLRGYPDMATRAAGLNAFYGGPTWMAHRDRANATMIDSDNVLLLEPASNATAISVGPRSTATSGDSLVVATIYSLRPESASSFPKLFDEIARPMLVGAGAAVLGEYVTSPHPNNFPRLPIREGERVFVVFSRFPGVAAHDAHRATLAGNRRWTGDVAERLGSNLRGAEETLRLAPTARSRLR
ncbi:MAG: NIPSNAP family protein [Acidobacteria bacterium]|nr:MAG: NIPSNAP family protein [Acidobacteriota bacterium]